MKAVRSSPVVLSCSALLGVMFQRSREAVEQGPRGEDRGGDRHEGEGQQP